MVTEPVTSPPTYTPIRSLLWLRGKLLIRQFTRERGRIVGAVVALVVFGPMIAGATFGTAAGYTQLPNQWPTALLGGVLVLLWFVWLIFPIIFSSINEGMDVTRLLIYPLSRRDLVISTLLGTLFDYPTYLMLPLFGAILWGFDFHPVVLIGVVLSYAHVIIIGQLIATSIGGILQSRRFRDVAIIFFSLLGMSCYFLQIGFQSFITDLTDDISGAQLERLQPLNILQWFPTGAIAKAIELTQSHSWIDVTLWLGYSFIWLLLLIWIWTRLLYRLATGAGFLLGSPAPQKAKEKKETAVQKTRLTPASLFDWLPDDINALVIKEFRSAWRLPQRRIGLIQGLIFPLFIAGSFFFTSGGSDVDLPFFLVNAIGLFLPLYGLFMFWALTQNMMAWEGRGLATLLLTPIPRQRIFYAKAIALLTLTAGPYLLIGSGLLIMAPSWLTGIGLITGLFMGLTAFSVTAVASVMFPMRINLEAKRMQGNFSFQGGGCRSALASTFLVPIAIGAFSLPAALPLLLSWWLEQPWISLVGLPLVLLYAGLLFYYSSQFAGSLLLEREAKLMEILKQPEEA